MSGIQAVITMEVPFQGDDEEFSNVFYMGDGGGIGSVPGTTKDAILTGLKDWMKPIFANNVRFLRGYARDLDIFNQPVSGEGHTLEFSGTEYGTYGIPATNMYGECAVMLRWLIGGRRFLRNMFHTQVPHSLDVTGRSSQNATNSSSLVTFAQHMLNDPISGFYRIAPNGDRPVSILYPTYLEHRQFHEGRKRSGILG
jgi:hypothetical protein